MKHLGFEAGAFELGAKFASSVTPLVTDFAIEVSVELWAGGDVEGERPPWAKKAPHRREARLVVDDVLEHVRGHHRVGARRAHLFQVFLER